MQRLRWALSDAETIERYWSHVRVVPGSSCAWWAGALSGRGHGRFWLGRVEGRDVAVIAHRFAFGLVHGADELLATRVLGHACDFSPRLRRLSRRLDRQELVLTVRAEFVGCFW